MIFGEKIPVVIPKNSKTGDRLEILTKGYIVNQNTRGNLLIDIEIEMPETITEREEKLYEQILKLEKQKLKAKLMAENENK